MSETFHFVRDFHDGAVAHRDRMSVEAIGKRLLVTVSESAADGWKQYAIAALPAAVARRLRDWLCERYPETEKENG